MTKPSAGARFIGMGGNLGNSNVGNGSVPTAVHWSEAVAVLVSGLASIAKLGSPEVRAIAVDTLSRASEAVPSVT
jgi:hypothetical protein